MRLIIGLIACGVLLSTSMAFAADDSIESRISRLEKGVTPGWLNSVEISGVIEVEAAYGSDYDDVKTSDVDLTDVELNIEVELTDYASGFALFMWETDADGVIVDEGGITIGSVDNYGVAVTAGKLYVPFGVFETGMISDPLTLELGETREGALQVDFGGAGFYGAAYTFNGDIQEAGEDDDMVDSFGINAGYAFESDSFGVDVSAGWISNLSSGSGFGDSLEDIDIDNYASAATFSAVATFANFTAIGEYLTVLDDDYLVAAGSAAKPATWNLELIYAFDMGSHGASVAATYQGSDEAGGFLPESRLGASFGYGIADGLIIALEYLHDEDYNVADGGTDEAADLVTCQLALEF